MACPTDSSEQGSFTICDNEWARIGDLEQGQQTLHDLLLEQGQQALHDLLHGANQRVEIAENNQRLMQVEVSSMEIDMGNMKAQMQMAMDQIDF